MSTTFLKFFIFSNLQNVSHFPIPYKSIRSLIRQSLAFPSRSVRLPLTVLVYNTTTPAFCQLPILTFLTLPILAFFDSLLNRYHSHVIGCPDRRMMLIGCVDARTLPQIAQMQAVRRRASFPLSPQS
jgi:hypothetical protein